MQLNIHKPNLLRQIKPSQHIQRDIIEFRGGEAPWRCWKRGRSPKRNGAPLTMPTNRSCSCRALISNNNLQQVEFPTRSWQELEITSPSKLWWSNIANWLALLADANPRQKPWLHQINIHCFRCYFTSRRLLRSGCTAAPVARAIAHAPVLEVCDASV